MTTADISVKTNDFDTIGERLSRARDARNSSVAEVAELAGVEVETLEAWESDKSEPRSNRLTMLAGILGVSPTWLLFGRGASPIEESSSTDLESLELRLGYLKSQRQKINAAIEQVEHSLDQAQSENSN